MMKQFPAAARSDYDLAQASRMPFQSDDYVGLVYHYFLGMITHVRNNDGNWQLLSGHKPEMSLPVRFGTVRDTGQLKCGSHKGFLRVRILYDAFKGCINERLGLLGAHGKRREYTPKENHQPYPPARLFNDMSWF